MKSIKETIRETLDLPALLEELGDEGTYALTGFSGSASSCLCSLLLAAFAKNNESVLIITDSDEAAEDLMDDLETFGLPGLPLFMPWDVNLDGEYIRDPALISGKVGILSLLRSDSPGAVIMPVTSLMQPLPSPGLLEKHEFVIRTGDTLDLGDIAKQLVAGGFERTPLVQDFGEFSIRGGIFDVFPFGSEEPFRVELFGDTVDSIRTFSPVSQESRKQTTECDISRISGFTVMADVNDGRGKPLSAYADHADRIILLNTAEVFERAKKRSVSYSASKTPFYRFEQTLNEISAPSLIHITEYSYGSLREIELPRTLSNREEFSDMSDPVARLGNISLEHSVMVFCQNSSEESRLKAILKNVKDKNESSITIRTGFLSSGFTLTDAGLVVATTREIFNRYKTRRRIHKSYEASKFSPVSDFYALNKGDYVVHLNNGIGIFRGMEIIEKEGVKEEFLLLEYANRVKLYVPIRNIDLVQKYIGGMKERPELDTLGGTKWAKRKKKIQKAIADVAQDLLEIQTKRFSSKGFAFPADTDWQHEFEASFIYEDTPDQVDALEAIKNDMESDVPMDRLLCGDVGFGKTEMAVRAAFKAAASGKQTAVLVPTTILAQQHYNTFRERMAEYPVEVDFLSRFKSKASQKASVEKLNEGKTDIMIGTHRLLSKDIRFKNLGLLIIDEEQRFGVMHKEKLKKMRETIDILTLTATPIPRTMHMSLLGIKDISSLRTPPEERKPILTKVTAFNDRIISQAVRTELSRGGQVFFVNNRVYNIDYYVKYIKKLVPEARVSKVHGQMPEGEIKTAMDSFLEGHSDVLVCTVIIESGIDMPNVNTLIINNADHFGLSDLHQLRGRVGRFTRQAYAYLLIPSDKPVTEEAGKRLRTIERYSSLGAGFEIALRDLEIRGAGNILGAEQSGHIAAVGYDLYCRMLENTFRKKSGDEPVELAAETVDMELGLPAYIPEEYIQDFRPKIEMYRKIQEARTAKEIRAVEAELRDRFGEVPQQVSMLLDLQKLSSAALRKKIKTIVRSGKNIKLTFRQTMPPISFLLPKRNQQPDSMIKYIGQFIDDIDVNL